MSVFYDYLLRPQVFFARQAAHPPFGMAIGLIVALSLLWSCAMLLDRRARGRRDAPQKPDRVFATIRAPLVMLLAFGCVAFVSVLLLDLIHSGRTVERVFTLIALAALPRFASWLTHPVRNASYRATRAWAAAYTVITAWCIVFVFTACASGLALPWWKALVAGLPAAAALSTIAVAERREEPDTLAEANPWRRVAGKRVLVYYSDGAPELDVAAIAAGSDVLLGDVERALAVGPLPYRLYIFLMPDEATFRRLMRIRGKVCTGYACHDCIAVEHRDWDRLRSVVAHEMAHMLRKEFIARETLCLLDEGLAEWATEAVGATERYPAERVVGAAPYFLAVHAVFFDWLHAEHPYFGPEACYATARSFARFVIARHGLDNFKRLCARAAPLGDRSPGDVLNAACKQVFGETLGAVERAWRESLQPEQPTVPPPTPDAAYPRWINASTAPEGLAWKAMRRPEP